MLRSPASAFALFVATAAAVAQESADRLVENRVATHAASDAWRSAHGSTWQISIDERTGRADFVGGGRIESRFAPRADADWFQAARSHADAAAALLGVDASTLVEERVKLLPLGLVGTTDKMTARFTQELDGVPVLGGFLNVLMDMQGGLLSIQSTALVDLAGVPTRPSIAPADASALALAAFESRTGLPGEVMHGPQLGIGGVEVDRRLLPFLVWEVAVHWRAPGAEPEGTNFWIDARDGSVRQERTAIHHDVGGQVRTRATTNTAPDGAGNPEVSTPMPFVRISSSAGELTADALGNFLYPGVSGPLDVTIEYLGPFVDVEEYNGANHVLTATLVSTGSMLLMNPATTATITSQANAYVHVNLLRNWVRSVDPADDTADFQALANVNLNETCNAYFDGSSVNFFATGGGCVNTSYSTVVAHEMGHWLNVLYGTGNGSDGMGEGNADVFAMYLYDTPVVGQDFCGPGCHIRTGLNNTQFCGDCCPGCHGGGVHREGEVWGGAAWKVRARLNTTHGNATGDAISAALFSAWMNGYDQAQIKSVIETQWLVLDDDNGFIEDGTPHYTDIDLGFRAQGFPGFDLPAIFFPSVTQLADTPNETGPYQVDATIIAQLFPPLFTEELFHRVNGGPWTSLGMILGAGNSYYQFIPGQNSPATVDYYIRAGDSIGNVMTYPAGAPDEFLQFHVGILNVVMFADFESADDQGWTHGSFGDTPNPHDDFQRGTPAGLGGDPDQAVSGEKVWGNDLGQEPWNGIYQNVQHNWLRSPVLDCSEAVNSELRFWRWLSVEDSLHDRASVKVNGIEIWANDPTAATLDSEWKFESFDVSSIVDGEPAVQIEFSLQSDGAVAFGGWNIDDVELRYLAPSDGSVGTSYCFGDGSGTPCPCNNTGGAGEGCANSTGFGGVLESSGSASAAADDLAFAGTHLLPNQPALLFAGLNAVNGGNGVAFGDGLRCAGGATVRLGVKFANVSGGATWGPGLGATGGWGGGDTRRFQVWYRNPGGSPCGTNFNLSHGVSIDFVP